MNKTYKYTLTAHEKKEISFDTGVSRLAIANGDGVDGSTTVIMSEITKRHSGDIVSFLDGADAPFAELTVNITAQQSGSGDPSPTNVRPITGWTGANVYVSDEDTSSPTTYNINWQSVAGTVYGGKIKPLTGVLISEYGYKRLDDLTWTQYHNDTTGHTFQADVPNGIKPVASNSSLSSIICSCYKTRNFGSVSSWITDNNVLCQVVGTPQKIFIRDERYSDAQTFSANLGDNGFIYEYETEQSYQLTPIEVRSLLGVNNVWADCGAVDVRYFVQSTQSMIDYIDDKTENVVEIFKATDEGGGVYTLDDVTCDELCTYARDHINIVLKVARYNSAISYDIFILSDYIGTSAVFRHTMITSAIGGGSLLYVRELQADSGNATKVLTTRDINISANS